jgi:predicted DNA binding protein
MATAKLEITLPEGIWIRDISVRHPEATFTVPAVLGEDETGIGLLEVKAPDVETVLADIEAAEGVTSVDPLRLTETDALLQFETSEPLLLMSIQQSGIPLEPPVTVVDGTATLSVTAPRDRLSELADQLEAFGMTFEVQHVRQTVDSADLLTQGQREIVTRAVELGYYDTPRDCTLTELAADLGVAKSTASERLHRAEEKVVKEFLADSPGIDPEQSRAGGG